MLLVFQLNMYNGKTVDKQSHIKSSVTLRNACIFITFQHFILIDDLINTATSRNMLMIHNYQMQTLGISLHMNLNFTIFTDKPLTSLIKRRKLQLIFYLLKFCIRQRFSV